MLKIKTNEEHIEIEMCGNLPQLCSELAQVINAIKDRLAENDHALGHEFKVVFTKGFMDGVVFQEDREHMEHYLAEGDKKCDKTRNEAVDMLNGLIDFLKEKSAGLKKAKKELDELLKENDDEAE